MSRKSALGPRPTSSSKLTDSQWRVLDAVDKGWNTAGLVSEAIGLHHNMTRRHLQALVAEGLVSAALAVTDGPGRPASVYELTDAGQSVLAGAMDGLQDNYFSLVASFAGALDGTRDAAKKAEAVGADWAGRVRTSKGAAKPEQALELQGALGFSPEEQEDGSVALRTCPLLESAKEHQRVTCAVHLGLVRAAGAPKAELEPFAAEGACLLHLTGK